MTIDPQQLLRALGASFSSASRGSGAASGDLAVDFQSLLDRARAGEVRSGAVVRAAPGAGVSLSDDQTSRLSAAADVAEANGVGRGVFLIDGMALTMDVATRTITGAVPAEGTQVFADLDAVISVAPPGDGSTGKITPPPATTAGLNATLLEALARRDAA